MFTIPDTQEPLSSFKSKQVKVNTSKSIGLIFELEKDDTAFLLMTLRYNPLWRLTKL